jgi:hypothetical protein
MKKYLVIVDKDLGQFTKEIEDWLKRGWHLAGGVAAANDRFYQAISCEVNKHGDVL